MAQAVVDLPDPLEQPPAPLENADELLAQLAGDEIDRLLAQQDVEHTPPNSSDAKIPPPPPPQPAAATGTPQAQPLVGSQINSLFEDLKKARIAPSPAPAPDQFQSATDAVNDDPMEKAALMAAAGFDTTAAPSAPADAPVSDESFDQVDGEESPLPIYLKPLAWISALVPSPFRSAVGKLAIITLINAAAIIAYVLLVKKH